MVDALTLATKIAQVSRDPGADPNVVEEKEYNATFTRRDGAWLGFNKAKEYDEIARGGNNDGKLQKEEMAKYIEALQAYLQTNRIDQRNYVTIIISNETERYILEPSHIERIERGAGGWLFSSTPNFYEKWITRGLTGRYKFGSSWPKYGKGQNISEVDYRDYHYFGFEGGMQSSSWLPLPLVGNALTSGAPYHTKIDADIEWCSYKSLGKAFSTEASELAKVDLDSELTFGKYREVDGIIPSGFKVKHGFSYRNPRIPSMWEPRVRDSHTFEGTFFWNLGPERFFNELRLGAAWKESKVNESPDLANTEWYKQNQTLIKAGFTRKTKGLGSRDTISYFADIGLGWRRGEVLTEKGKSASVSSLETGIKYDFSNGLFLKLTFGGEVVSGLKAPNASARDSYGINLDMGWKDYLFWDAGFKYNYPMYSQDDARWTFAANVGGKPFVWMEKARWGVLGTAYNGTFLHCLKDLKLSAGIENERFSQEGKWSHWRFKLGFSLPIPYLVNNTGPDYGKESINRGEELVKEGTEMNADVAGSGDKKIGDGDYWMRRGEKEAFWDANRKVEIGQLDGVASKEAKGKLRELVPGIDEQVRFVGEENEWGNFWAKTLRQYMLAVDLYKLGYDALENEQFSYEKLEKAKLEFAQDLAAAVGVTAGSLSATATRAEKIRYWEGITSEQRKQYLDDDNIEKKVNARL